MASATTSESLSVNVAVSTANGEPYLLAKSSLNLPDPWHTTVSAIVLFILNKGEMACVPFNIGG